MAQKYDAQLVDNLAVAFPRRAEASYAWGRAVSCILNISPHLRFFIPFGSVDENLDAYDLSGQGRVITQLNMVAASYATYGALVPYVQYAAVSTRSFYRLDEPGIKFTGAFTWVCWLFPKDLTNLQMIMTKAGNVGNQEQMLMARGDLAGDPVQLRIGDAAGAASYTAQSPNPMLLNTWQYVAGRFVPSTSVDVFLDDQQGTNLVGIPAAAFNNVVPFRFGARGVVGVLTNHLTASMGLAAGWATDLSNPQIEAIRQATRPLFYGV